MPAVGFLAEDIGGTVLEVDGCTVNDVVATVLNTGGIAEVDSFHHCDIGDHKLALQIALALKECSDGGTTVGELAKWSGVGHYQVKQVH